MATTLLGVLRPLLENPYVALILGSFVGAGLIGILLWGFRHLTVENAEFGLVWVGGATFGGMVVALALLAAYNAVARAGFAWFAGAVVVVFLGGALLVAVRAGSAGLTGRGGS